MSRLKEFAQHLVDSAVEKSRPTRERHQRLSAKDAIREACRADQRTSGNWGFWIRQLSPFVEKAISEDDRQNFLKRRKKQVKHEEFA